MAAAATITNSPSNRSSSAPAKRQDAPCTMTIWTTTWLAPNYIICSAYQTFAPCEDLIHAASCPYGSQTSTSSLAPSIQHQDQSTSSTPDAGTVVGGLVGAMGLIGLGFAFFIVWVKPQLERRHRKRDVVGGGPIAEENRGGQAQNGSDNDHELEEMATGVQSHSSSQTDQAPVSQNSSQGHQERRNDHLMAFQTDGSEHSS